MLLPNNPQIDFAQLNQTMSATLEQRYPGMAALFLANSATPHAAYPTVTGAASALVQQAVGVQQTAEHPHVNLQALLVNCDTALARLAQRVMVADTPSNDDGQAQVNQLYWALYQRAADPSGLAYYQPRLASGESVLSLARELIRSPEAAAARHKAPAFALLDRLDQDQGVFGRLLSRLINRHLSRQSVIELAQFAAQSQLQALFAADSTHDLLLHVQAVAQSVQHCARALQAQSTGLRSVAQQADKVTALTGGAFALAKALQ